METGSYQKPIDDYCILSDMIIDNFSDKIVFEHYNSDNIIPIAKLEMLYDIISYNMNKINKVEKPDQNNKEEWMKMVLNTPGYYINICFYEGIIVGFSSYMYLEMGLMVCEIQIEENYQGKYHILKNIIKDLYDNTDKTKFKKVYATISKNNIKSINVFTHIGFKNTKGILYEIYPKQIYK